MFRAAPAVGPGRAPGSWRASKKAVAVSAPIRSRCPAWERRRVGTSGRAHRRRPRRDGRQRRGAWGTGRGQVGSVGGGFVHGERRAGASHPGFGVRVPVGVLRRSTGCSDRSLISSRGCRRRKRGRWESRSGSRSGRSSRSWYGSRPCQCSPRQPRSSRWCVWLTTRSGSIPPRPTRCCSRPTPGRGPRRDDVRGPRHRRPHVRPRRGPSCAGRVGRRLGAGVARGERRGRGRGRGQRPAPRRDRREPARARRTPDRA